MTILPQTLEGWSLDAITQVVREGVFESRTFDFKETCPPASDEKGKLRLRKTLVAFANNPGGGFLIIGIKDDRDLEPNARIIGVEPTLDVPEHLKAQATSCVPRVQWTFRNPPHMLPSGRRIHVIQIFEGGTKPHGIFDGERWSFAKRTDGGNELLSYEEIREAFRDQLLIRRNLEVIRVEASRMEKHAQHLNAGAWNGYADQYLALLFRPAVLEAALTNVLADISDDEMLVENLNNLRAAAAAADAEAGRLLAIGGSLEPITRWARLADNSAHHVTRAIEQRLR